MTVAGGERTTPFQILFLIKMTSFPSLLSDPPTFKFIISISSLIIIATDINEQIIDITY